MDTADEKRTARARARAAAEGVVIDHRAHVVAIAAFLEREVPATGRIVVYDAIPGEVDLAGLVAGDAAPSQRFALTRTPDVGHELTVHPLGGPTERHRYGYRQPVADGPRVADDAIGAVLVPALAFDRRGNRLGRGAGYYDRFLARLGPGVLRIGLCAVPPVEALPVDGHDVAMTHLSLGGRVEPVPLTAGDPADADRSVSDG